MMPLPIKYLSQKEFDELPSYNSSVPTACRAGNKWKRRNYIFSRGGAEYNGYYVPKGCKEIEERWFFGEYVQDKDPEYIITRWSIIKIGIAPHDELITRWEKRQLNKKVNQ